MNNRPEPPQRGDNKDPKNAPSGSPIPNAQRIWLAVGAFVLLLFLLMIANNRGNSFGGTDALSYPDLARLIMRGDVTQLIIADNGEVQVRVEGRSQPYRMFKEPLGNLREEMYALGVTTEQWRGIQEITAVPSDNSSAMLFNLLIAIVPTLLIVWLLWRMMRSVRMGQDQAMSFGRSRARVNRDMERPQVTFSDVAGADEAKEELKEVVEFLKEPDKFIRLGARVPKGVLMVGPPGTGKTLMARAVAGEAGVPFFSISGSEFVEMFVGVGASRVRDLFDRAKAEAPAIVFVDEIDAVGRHRGAGLGGGHDEREQTLNQILVEMDGFETGTNIIVLASTNRPDILDPALLRPGRFDRKVIMDNPDVKGRLDILKVHAKGKPLAQSVDLESIAKITPGFSGADLENLINEAAILAARRNLKNIGMSELQEAMERVVMGPERRTRVITEGEKKKIAYHEAGHAILQHVLEYADPVHKITIVPRGRAGGYVMSLPDSDIMLKSREEFEDDIVAVMGGRAAEEIVFNQLTTGASNDLQQATRIARAMVTKFGMSDLLGPRSYEGGSGGNIFLGRELSEMREYSEHYAQEIDNEVKRILQKCYDRAKNILSSSREKLDTLAGALIEHETLDRQTFEQLMDTMAGAAPAPAMFDSPAE